MNKEMQFIACYLERSNLLFSLSIFLSNVFSNFGHARLSLMCMDGIGILVQDSSTHALWRICNIIHMQEYLNNDLKTRRRFTYNDVLCVSCCMEIRGVGLNLSELRG